MRRRVVMTGAGLVTAAGSDAVAFWKALMQGRSFVRPLSGFAYAELGQLLGAEVVLPENDRIGEQLDPNPYRARCLELALAAARRAIAEAAPSLNGVQRQTAGVIIGTTMGEERQLGASTEVADQEGSGIDGHFFARTNNHRLAATIAAEHGLSGPVYNINTACSSGNAAIALAYDLISSGEADVMLAGGADTLTRLIYCGFHRMGALSYGI
jgi:3-oxoacyl-[acyl-carrier-protein] synthase II